MTSATETIDRRDRVQTSAEELPRQDIWMETSLPWNTSFWEKLTGKTLMRLNPHWHIEKDSAIGFPVEDVLVETEFHTAPTLSLEAGIFRAEFPEVGLTLSARACGNGTDTALSFHTDTPEGSPLTAEDAARTMQYWLPSLREYYRLHESNSIKHRFWRFFMDKVMLTMNPTQRRISGFMFKLTVLECLLTVILGVGWFYYGT
ncbi:hypothetical protein [Pseudodesulfovibrio piezophilus]|uniref:Uncharacterized protein n=1 Tax=Pseudodesulfovibrio piezophilus (strain DSM 21447 / JCM 15486 / C1TLV30) TaxID=1322246 RepID=M1WWR2_PSEP2|nr:hypothetical protein [Pseudodesulfovibrio piezophilus]CCH49278.1 protein of unknown function [Pseudodesulfovibrio piezophilus C1TLV30]